MARNCGQTMNAWTEPESYEGYIGRWSRAVAPEFLAWLHTRRSGRWLDDGCGTGELTRAIIKLSDPEAVDGFDLARGERVLDAFRQHDTSGNVGARQDHRELFAAPAAGTVDLANDLAHRLRKRVQRTVTGGMSVLVVDRLDPVEIGEHETQVAAEPLRASDFFVVVLPADRRYWSQQSRRIGSARPDATGKFIFRGLPAGDYRIAATTDLIPGDLSDASALTALLNQSTPVTLALGEKRTFDLKIGG